MLVVKKWYVAFSCKTLTEYRSIHHLLSSTIGDVGGKLSKNVEILT